MEGGSFRLADEVRYIQHRAADYDGRIVTIGQLVLFSTETGDAWLLDRTDFLAARLARNVDQQGGDLRRVKLTFGNRVLAPPLDLARTDGPHAGAQDDQFPCRHLEDFLCQQERSPVRMFGVGLSCEVEPREPTRAVLGNDVHRRVAEALFQFLREFQVAGAEHDLRAEVVENVRRAMLAIEFPQLGLVLHHKGEPHTVAADELGGMRKTVDAAQAGKLIQQHERLHAHVAVLLRCLDRVEVDQLIEEQGYIAGRDRHIDCHRLLTQVPHVEVAGLGGRGNPGIVPDLQAGGDGLADTVHLPDVAVDVIADAVGHDTAIVPVRVPAPLDLASQPFDPVAAGKDAQHVGHGERLIRRLGQERGHRNEGGPAGGLPEPVGARIAGAGVVFRKELEAHARDLVEAFR